jgi:hypothetical protein
VSLPPTRQEIAAARTPAGGWTRAQLADWGVPWPPPKGWKKRLEGEREPGDDLDLRRASREVARGSGSE